MIDVVYDQEAIDEIKDKAWQQFGTRFSAARREFIAHSILRTVATARMSRLPKYTASNFPERGAANDLNF